MSNRHEAPDGSGSLQPGRPPTNTSFITPDTQRDRSNTVRVVQIIHSNIGLNLGLLDCPKRCRAEELTALLLVLLTLMFHTVLVVGYLPIFDTVCQ